MLSSRASWTIQSETTSKERKERKKGRKKKVRRGREEDERKRKGNGRGEKLSTSVIKIIIKPRAWPNVLCLLLYPCDQIDAPEVDFIDEKLNLLNSEFLCKARSLVNDESGT